MIAFLVAQNKAFLPQKYTLAIKKVILAKRKKFFFRDTRVPPVPTLTHLSWIEFPIVINWDSPLLF